jgi:hypothetical protein
MYVFLLYIYKYIVVSYYWGGIRLLENIENPNRKHGNGMYLEGGGGGKVRFPACVALPSGGYPLPLLQFKKFAKHKCMVCVCWFVKVTLSASITNLMLHFTGQCNEIICFFASNTAKEKRA